MLQIESAAFHCLNSTMARKNPCPFCGKMLSKLAKHILRVHSEEPEVDRLEERSAELHGLELLRYRRRQFRLLSTRGQGRHNAWLRSIGSGEALISARKAEDTSGYLECPDCLGLFKNLRRHNCAQKQKTWSAPKVTIKSRERRRMALISAALEGNPALADFLAQMRLVKLSIYKESHCNCQ